MANWDSEQYLKFKEQRTQPAVDLAKRIQLKNPRSILDIGCGPGNSTAVLKELFPASDITGIDSSAEMIAEAEKSHSDLNFKLCDISEISSGYDVIFSNACLQWVPEHEKLIPSLIGKLNSKGSLAVQVPFNENEPLYKIIEEVKEEPRWGFQKFTLESNKILKTEEYFNILSACADDFDIWETIYYHHMPSHQSLLEWVQSTRLRPYLKVLDKAAAELFEKEILQRVKKAYPTMDNGTVLLRFRRLFFVATKK